MTPHTPYSMLLASTKNHRMTVRRDDGLYRHVQFSEPGTNIWRFDLITWPGHLVITGDLEDFHFARIPDMFDFFRTKAPGEINESYWGEKLRGPVRIKSFSPERYKQFVFEYFRRWDPDHVHPAGPLWRAIREELLDDADVIDENEAHLRLMNFEFRYDADRFEFIDSWEWDLRDWDWHFQVSLHAIVWGIRQWDTVEHKTEADWLREELAEKRAYLKSLGDDEKHHVVKFDESGYFNAQHPLHERVGNQLLDCAIHETIRAECEGIGMPGLGSWRLKPAGEHNLDRNWIWERV